MQYLAQRAGAYWLLDSVAIYQREPQVRDDPMLQEIQFWKLTVHPDRSAVLRCERDEGDVAITKDIPFSDFPLETVTLYFQNGTLLLPSEY